MHTLVVGAGGSLRFAEHLNRSWRNTLSCRPFSASSYSNQSRGGLPRFYSDVLPANKCRVVLFESKVMNFGI